VEKKYNKIKWKERVYLLEVVIKAVKFPDVKKRENGKTSSLKVEEMG
jgi:hypothetical protein